MDIEGIIRASKKYVDDAVCPVCFKPVPWPHVKKHEEDRYGRQFRDYFAWCSYCEMGCMVIQFKRDGRWVIFKYQGYELGPDEETRPSGKWVTLNNVPVPEGAVVTGQGDYQRQHYNCRCHDNDKCQELLITDEQMADIVNTKLQHDDKVAIKKTVLKRFAATMRDCVDIMEKIIADA